MLIQSMPIRLVLFATAVALSLGGCNKTADETSKDVTQAREKASQEVSEARQDASQSEATAENKVIDAEQAYAKSDADARAKVAKVESEAMSTMAKADFEVAITEAKGRYNIGTEKCGILGGVEKKACISKADATLKADEALAIANRDAALVAAKNTRLD